MSAWTDARDNIKDGLASAWVALPVPAKAYLAGVLTGGILGVIAVLMARV